MELLDFDGEGLVVIADRDDELPWTADVLANVQTFAISHGFYVSYMAPGLHQYHLDDNPELRSCNMMLQSRPGNERRFESSPIQDPKRLQNFYGEGASPDVRYVLERHRVDYGKAHTDEYRLETWDEADE